MFRRSYIDLMINISYQVTRPRADGRKNMGSPSLPVERRPGANDGGLSRLSRYVRRPQQMIIAIDHYKILQYPGASAAQFDMASMQHIHLLFQYHPLPAFKQIVDSQTLLSHIILIYSIVISRIILPYRVRGISVWSVAYMCDNIFCIYCCVNI